MKEVQIRRGDIYYADLSPVVGSEQGGVRPVLVIQNDVGNRHSPTVICAAITSRMNKAKLPIRTIDKQRLKDYVCRVDKELMRKVDEALCVSLMLHT